MLRGRTRAWRALTAVTAVGLLAAGCSSDENEASDDTEETEETEATEATEETDAPATTDAPDTTDVPETEAPTTTSTTTPPTTVPPTLPATVPPQTTTPEEPAEGEVLLHDDFDDDSNQWGADSLDDEFATGVIEDGFLSFSISQSFLDTLPEGQVAVPAIFWPSALDDQASSMSNVRVETTVALTPGGSAGLVCGLDPTIEDQRFYSFNISSAGVATINEFTADGEFNNLGRNPEDIPQDPPAFPADPAFEYDEASLYTLAAECSLGENGAELTLELDGEVLVTASDTEDPIPFGSVGVNYGESTLINAVEGFQPFGVVFDTFDVIDLGDSSLESGGDEPAGGAFQSECTDETGDLTDDKGNPIEVTEQGIDLTAASIESDGETLTVVWELAEAPPADTSSFPRQPSWQVFFNLADGELIQVLAFQDGTELGARMGTNLASGPDVDGEITLDGTTLTAQLPLEGFTPLAEFDWHAVGQFGPGVVDFCPSDFGDIAVP